ncbi:PREDICTED: aldo-keto reductase AKR2E4-like [Papilio polytes]|uniref:aldo-keto reductase AKR2E4-like n=1 Tax=Papilio polytes TaxID=76194 RepID=UPI00067674E1|nr:PREDICTED: aldo-keto reductase AKR2E4-like [Papilio polytes]
MMLFLFILTMVYTVFCDSNDGGKAPRILLNDGNTMPVFGLGTFLGFDENGQKQVKESEVELPVTWALNSGYRLIDTASLYFNEEQVGRGIQKSSVTRENVFVVTKLGLNEQRHVLDSLRASLARLNTSYVDLYLIHNPVALKADHSGFDVVDYVDTWRSMEEAKALGLAKSIGISNFNISQITRLLDNCHVKPAVLQVEVNLNLAQDKLIEYAKKENIAVMAYTPFGGLFSKSRGPPPPRKDHPALVKLANKYNKTTPQIVLRYLVQRGVIPIPKTVHKERIEENIDIFNFELTPEEMKLLAEFNKDYRTVWPSFWQDHPYYPFEKKDVPDPDIFKAGVKV